MRNTLFLVLLFFITLGCEELPVEKNQNSVTKVSALNTINGFQDGDIIFQKTTSDFSRAIAFATQSEYTHVGIIFNYNKETFVLEAVQPVKITPINDWINHGKDNHYVVKRLKNAKEILTKTTLAKMEKIGKNFHGKNYDSRFEWSNDRIYCSELVYKIYENGAGIKLAELERLGDMLLEGNANVKKQMDMIYGGNVPLDEMLITPIALFNSPILEETKRGGTSN